MTQDEPERVEDITASLRECAALDWIDSTFAAATMREAADEIERLRLSISVSEKRAEHLQKKWVLATEQLEARLATVESERDFSQASLLRVEAILRQGASCGWALTRIEAEIRTALSPHTEK